MGNNFCTQARKDYGRVYMISTKIGEWNTIWSFADSERNCLLNHNDAYNFAKYHIIERIEARRLVRAQKELRKKEQNLIKEQEEKLREQERMIREQELIIREQDRISWEKHEFLERLNK